MKKDLCEIIVVMDRSGSMSSMWDEALGGFNGFIDEQKKLPGDVRFTLIGFDTEYDVVYAGFALKDVPPLTNEILKPRGSTALFDAVGKTILDTGARLSALPESDRPEKILVVIITDGHENSSNIFSGPKIKEMVAHQESKYNWKFIYLAKAVDNFDAIQHTSVVPGTMGVHGVQGVTGVQGNWKDVAGITGIYTQVNVSVSNYRAGLSPDLKGT